MNLHIIYRIAIEQDLALRRELERKSRRSERPAAHSAPPQPELRFRLLERLFGQPRRRSDCETC